MVVFPRGSTRKQRKSFGIFIDNLVCLLLATGLIASTGCAGISAVGSPPSTSNPVTISISPSNATVESGGSLQFTALVSGTSKTAVTWLASAGSISANGLLQAPTLTSATNLTVSATSQANSEAKASAVVSVTVLAPKPIVVSQCSIPTYLCARTDTLVIPLPAPLPDWGGSVGASNVFTDPSFNSQYPPQYARVTDSSSGTVGGNINSGFAVGSGSGDDSHFNLNDTLFWITDSGAAPYFYGLNPATMATGLVYYEGTWCGAGMWSQVNSNYFYDVCYGELERFDFTGLSLTNPGRPVLTTVYDFRANCNVNLTYQFYQAGGSGANSTVFATVWSPEQQDPIRLTVETQVAVYNSATSTCYNYDTMSGIVRSYAGTQTPVTGTITCNGTRSVTGTNFNPAANAWTGINLTVGGTTTYQVASVPSSTAATLTTSCSTGGSYSAEPGTLVGVVTSSDRFSTHDIRIDPSGTYVLVSQGSQCPSTNCNFVHAWQIGTTTVLNCPYYAAGSDSGACGAHYTETASGWINADYFGSNVNSPSMQYRTWANFATTNSANVSQLNTYNGTALNDPNFDDHPTAKNDPSGTHGYPILTSTYAPDDPNSTLYAYSNEIIGWAQSSGPVMRFGHDFNSSQSSQFTAQYAIGAASATGKFYLFTTDGEGTLGNVNGTSETCSLTGGTCRSDVFILNLVPPAAN
jgi:hypothetical protein